MKVKRFAPLAMALAVLTTGGVFAAWSYAGTNAGSGVSPKLQFGMENVSISTSRGVYSVTTSGEKIFSIDQKKVDSENPANNDYTAVLKVADNAKIVIRFTPNKGVDGDIVENGLESKFFFTFKKGATPTKYKMDAQGNYDANGTEYDVVTLDSAQTTIYPKTDSPVAGNAYWTKASDNVSFVYELDKAAIEARVALSQDFVLDTIDEYYAFGDCLDTYTCAVVVQDPTATDTVTPQQ